MRAATWAAVAALVLLASVGVTNAKPAKQSTESLEHLLERLRKNVAKWREAYAESGSSITVAERRVSMTRADWQTVHHAWKKAVKFVDSVEAEKVELERNLLEKRGELATLAFNQTTPLPPSVAAEQDGVNREIASLQRDLKHLIPKMEGAKERAAALKARMDSAALEWKNANRRHKRALHKTHPTANGLAKALEDYLAALRADIRWRRVRNVPSRKQVHKFATRVKFLTRHQRRLQQQSSDPTLQNKAAHKLKKYRTLLSKAVHHDQILGRQVRQRIALYNSIRKELTALFKRHGWKLPPTKAKDELDEQAGEDDEDDE